MYITANAKVREHSGFHTKGYIFKKDESYQIIIGSSNLTQSALTYNKEWNTRLDSKENEKFVKMFCMSSTLYGTAKAQSFMMTISLFMKKVTR